LPAQKNPKKNDQIKMFLLICKEKEGDGGTWDDSSKLDN
jgi:hypothetical protein